MSNYTYGFMWDVIMHLYANFFNKMLVSILASADLEFDGKTSIALICLGVAIFECCTGSVE